MNAYQATSTWGDGPDVLLLADCEGYPTQYFDLTTDQAEKLACELINAVRVNRELDISIAFQEKQFTHEVRRSRLKISLKDALEAPFPEVEWVPCVVLTEDEGRSIVRLEDGTTHAVLPEFIRKREQ